ncbi:MAG: DMT family transporter [Hyphomicrobiales bacterium]
MQLPRLISYSTLLLAPLFFASNLLFGKSVIPNIEPWTLAFIRWTLVSLILFPFVFGDLRVQWKAVKQITLLSTIMGFLAMWICGAIVYYALSLTTATNATLIYLSSPAFIIMIEAVARGRRIKAREGIGIILASLGVAAILLRGDIATLTTLNFNGGDLAMVVAAIAWAVYSVVFKNKIFTQFSNSLMLFMFSGLAALCLMPFAFVEIILISPIPTSIDVWSTITGLVIFSSLAAFLAYQHSIRVAGPAISGIFMYLLPAYGVGLAVLILGESFEKFHLIGILTILGGVILSTFPVDIFNRWTKKAGESKPEML